MKKEIIAIISIYVLLIINTLFWNWFCWVWSVMPDNGAIVVLAVVNILMMVLATAYFAQKYDET